MKRYIYILQLILLLSLCSCIKNDLSYPDVDAAIETLWIHDADSVIIDGNARTVRIVLKETADVRKVVVDSLALSEHAEVVGSFPDILDLSSPMKLTLRVYEDFEWTISATQPILRYIKCDNQVGEAEIDVDRKTAYVYVLETQALSEVKINDLKLEPEGAIYAYTTGFVVEDGKSVSKVDQCEFPAVLDCVVMRYFTVIYKGQNIEWSVKFLHKQISCEVTSVVSWAYSAFVKGLTNGTGTPVIEYKKSSAQDWLRWDNLEVSGTSIFADITGLEPSTSYLVRVTNGTDTSEGKEFATGAAEQLPNLSFDDWYQDGAAWMPNANSSSYIWDSANPGTAGLGTVPTIPEESDVVKGRAARLETTTAMGMLAAGNIYVGQFGNVAGLGAELDWGYPFAARPLALRGYYKYAPKPIDMVKDPYKSLQGETDQCQIQILLTDWPDRFHINTSKKQFVDFENDKNIIAHGSLISSNTDSEYVKFSIPLIYRSNRIPKYIVIVGAASRYGDYFTGGKGSVLKLDEFELIYDSAELTDEEYTKVFGNLL